MMEPVSRNENKKEHGTSDRRAAGLVLYGVEDVPSPLQCCLLGLQHAIMCIGGSMSIPFILASLLCTDNRSEVISTLLSITMFMCGLATILQSLFGIRLGMIQGGSHAFIAPIVAMTALEKWKCPSADTVLSSSNTTTMYGDAWKDQMREIQGNLMLASVTQVVLGCTGLMGVLLPFIGPITIAPTISLVGLSLTDIVVTFSEKHWGIASLSACLTLIFTLYLGKIDLPIPVFSIKKRCHLTRYPLFQFFPLLLGTCISWLVCWILTINDVLPSDRTQPAYMARTDVRTHVLETATWFYWPLPFQFGTPTVSAAGFVGFLVVTIATITESVGDYYAAARISGAAPPPPHAINRGIAMEGICSIISGMVGAAHATTSYSINIGAIGITKVASRAVFVATGVILVLCGVVGKVGAVLTLIPDPIIGGTLAVLLGMVSAVGISTLKFVELESTRNQAIIGISLVLGLMVPKYISDPKNADAINTGYEELDQTIRVLLGTAIFVGGFIGCVLDNTVPGSYEERGISSWRQNQLITSASTDKNKSTNVYDFPYVTKFIRRVKCCSCVPVSPSFDKEISTCHCSSNKKMNVTEDIDVDAADELELRVLNP